MKDFLRKLVKLATEKDMSWVEHLDDRGKKDRDLITKIQSTPDHTLEHKEAMKKLTNLYRNTIAQQASKSQLSKIVGPDLAHGFGLGFFEDIVKRKFDLDQPNIKPISYITGNLFHLMQKEKDKHVDFAATKSAELTQKQGILHSAVPLLTARLNREPTDQELFEFIRDEMHYKVSLENIKKIKAKNRKEYSGDRTIGGESGAENLTWTDIHNVEEGTAADFRKDQAYKKRIEKYLPNFTRKERIFLRKYYRLGEFENTPAPNAYYVAKNSGMTHYEGTRIRDRMEKFIDNDFPDFA